MYLRNIRLRNIRDFEDISLDLTNEEGDPRLWTVVIGANGTGKTSLLRAIAIGLCNESDANAMLASPIGMFVTSGKTQGEIELTTSGSEGSSLDGKLTTILNAADERESVRREDDSHAQGSREPFLLGYGVSRVRAGKGEYRQYRVFDATRTLFDYDAELAPVELTIRRISDYLGTESYDHAMTGIKRALDLPAGTTISVTSGGGVSIRHQSMEDEIALEAWADGYRLNFSWIVDLFGWALQAGALTKDGGIRGILLVDELEQHTHPSIQMGFVPRLKELWPELQVIATTHSPMVVMGAQSDEVVVLKRTDGVIEAAPAAMSFDGYSAEDVLVDERLFDTPAHGPRTSEALSTYEQLAAIPPGARSEDEQRRMREVARVIGSHALPGASDTPLLREIKALREKYNL